MSSITTQYPQQPRNKLEVGDDSGGSWCLGCATAAEDVRMRLAHQLKGYDTVQTQPGECVFFRVGSDDGAIHSEPRMDRDDRIFVNVVPGTEEELRTLLQRWGMEFPRAWCLPSAL
ncbi:hypothetical protein EYZ11_008819 [Aspergillus tanneri]|uniref:Uncharacterized protein n=1 Tax=Aspergillus tanneri TaxID=1220188 RepID=A0A4S3J9J6_9EURO|nr:uncharacterized protein ATNIH1004_004408 [Aspergillus tanneri]KAA8648523.1 hypothetical protein ATNIH1004_004408 [Aspergillus tanneri]THC91716.1 hypothetical protein EYZ11_008819 [Aspergillus tanneri]